MRNLRNYDLFDGLRRSPVKTVIQITKHFGDYERNRKGSSGLRVFLLDYVDYEEIQGYEVIYVHVTPCNYKLFHM